MNKLQKTLLLSIISTSLLTACSSGLDVKKEIVLEYGQPISTNIVDYLNEDIKLETKDYMLNNSKLEILENKLEDDQSFQSVGNYVVKITCDNKSSEVTVIVQDTTKPVINGITETFDTYKDVKINYGLIFTAKDLSPTTIKIDDSLVDYSKEGSYKAMIIAQDKHGNVESKEFSVNVKKPEISVDISSKTVNVNETFSLNCSIKGYEDTASFKSSDPTIAEVTQTGHVKAKKPGTVTITASANGVEASCSVTVKSIPVTNKPNKKPTSSNKPSKPITPTPPSSPTVPPVQNYEPPKLVAKTSQEAFNLINAERTKNGLPAYRWDSSLANSATIRAREIVDKYSHVRPDGSDPLNMPNVFSEIICNRYSASSAVQAWLNSPNHRDAILRDDLGSAGVARCGEYWVALFGK